MVDQSLAQICSLQRTTSVKIIFDFDFQIRKFPSSKCNGGCTLVQQSRGVTDTFSSKVFSVQRRHALRVFAAVLKNISIKQNRYAHEILILKTVLNYTTVHRTVAAGKAEIEHGIVLTELKQTKTRDCSAWGNIR